MEDFTWTPAHRAVEQSRQPLTVHTTAILLAFGADPELRDPAGDVPMDVEYELVSPVASARSASSRAPA
ncbi:hypothetical protein [Streptomyces collinus]|uniref:hypothetical protein n=1 Tax=Streptomyces collinus TaxID=42684 RepID=UPI00341DF173